MEGQLFQGSAAALRVPVWAAPEEHRGTTRTQARCLLA
jgi:hypothetical protein